LEGHLVGVRAPPLRRGDSFVRCGRALPDDGGAIAPATLLRRVEPGCCRRALLVASQFHLTLQDRVVVLLEESDELVGVAPPGLVVVLHYERLARSGWRRLRRARDRRREEHREHRPARHGSLLKVAAP